MKRSLTVTLIIALNRIARNIYDVVAGTIEYK